jgi:hypothetical protein
MHKKWNFRQMMQYAYSSESRLLTLFEASRIYLYLKLIDSGHLLLI